MNGFQKTENAAAAAEAAAAAGRPQRPSSRGRDIEGGLIRYLAAEAYREKVEEEQTEKAPGAEG